VERRLFLAGIAAAVVSAIGGFAAASSTAITPVGPKPVTVALTTTSQQQISRTHKVRARVEVRQPGAYRLALTSIAGRARKPLARPTTIRFAKPKARKVRIKLTPAGLAAVSACRSQDLLLSVVQVGDPSIRAANRTGLDADAARCRVAAGGSQGSGSKDPGDQPPGGTSPGPAITNGDRCDWLDPADCLYPWPNDFFTRGDGTSPTGVRLNLQAGSMPPSRLGLPIFPGPYNVADGFSPGNMIITKIPGFDNQAAFDRSGAVPVTDMARYNDPDQPIVVINVDTGQRQPIWSEIDANPGSDADRTLIIRPARNFDEGGHYIVAIRNLVDKDGNPIQPNLGFKVYRDRLTTPQKTIEDRRPHMEEMFRVLQDDGIKRMNLISAWDFHVASEQTLTGRALGIRDKAFAQLGDTNLADMQVQGHSPDFVIDKVTNFSAAEDPKIAREVTGVVKVPCYLTSPGCGPGGTFLNLDTDDVPDQAPNNIMPAAFRCEIPRSAIDNGPNPARPSLYGHGLLGSLDEVGGGNVKSMAAEHNVMECAANWDGFSSADLPTVLLILQDLNLFPAMMDRTQQGFLDFLFLGRALIHPDGLSSNPAFQLNGHSLIDTQRLYYDGNSQGGILGGALTALAPDFNRAVLGVPGMNYSTLLERSTDFAPYAEGNFSDQVCGLLGLPEDLCTALIGDTPLGLYDSYPNELTRPLMFSIMQLLWDRAEPDGYAHHMTTDPLPNTPPHEVLLHPAFGDHQVANVAAETEARTIGAHGYKPGFYPGRSIDADPMFQIPAIPSFPFNGSAIVYYDGGPVGSPGGTTPPPTTDTPPVNGTPGNGADPHSYPRNDIKGRAQKSDFLMPNGVVNNYCTAQNNPLTDASLLTLGGSATPCYSHGFLGP
jgi:hypothetical protein